MKKNMGTTDKTIRIIAAIAIGILIAMNYITGTLAVILGLLAVIFLVTSAISYCPLYSPFDISSVPKEKIKN